MPKFSNLLNIILHLNLRGNAFKGDTVYGTLIFLTKRYDLYILAAMLEGSTLSLQRGDQNYFLLVSR